MRRRARTRRRNPRHASWRTRKSLAIVFAVVFAPAAAQRASAECVPFASPPLIEAADDNIEATPLDVDGDGDLDLVTAVHSGDNRVAWHENDGNADGWTIHTISTSGTSPRAAAGADLDGDGDADVVSGAGINDELAWHENLTGDGTSWTTTTITTALDTPDLLVLEDMDRDGDVDIVVGSGGSTDLVWFENDGGAAGWTVHTVTSELPENNALHLADVDGDGDLDVLLASSGSDPLLWFENGGAGDTWTLHTVDPDPKTFDSIGSADVDRDGDLDVVASTGFLNDVFWYENDGTGSGWTATTVSDSTTGAGGFAAADVDHDGDLDFALTSTSLDRLAWRENDGTGSGWTLHTVATSGDAVNRVIAVDLDRDGDTDLVATSFVDDELAWHRNDLEGDTPLFEALVTISDAFSSLKAARVVDLDRDGDLDVVGASFVDDQVAWVENLAGDASAWSHHTISTLAADVRAVVPADVDRDGDLDLLTPLSSSGGVLWVENLAGDASTWTPHLVASGLAGVYAVHDADLDGDGDLDVLSAAIIADVVAWHENLGDAATWTTHTIWTGGSSPASVASGDLDGDGDLDAVAAIDGSGLVTWHENTAGDGSAWSLHTVDGAATGAQGVRAADVDGDGDLDVLSAASDLSRIAWHENSVGDASSWSLHTVTTAALGAWNVSAADVDQDGDLDLLAASIHDDQIAWHENVAGDGSAWSAHVLSTASTEARRALAADLDHDGDLDVVAAAQFGPELHWFENRGTRVFGHGFETESFGDASANLGCWSTTLP